MVRRVRVRRRGRAPRPRRGHALPHRLDHEDLHGDRDHAAPRRGEAASGRSGRRVPPRAARRGQPVRAGRDDHDPPDAVARVGSGRRPAADRLDEGPLRELTGDQPRAGRGDRGQRAAEHAAEVLEPRVPIAGRDRRAGLRRLLHRSRPREHPRAAGHDLDRVRAAPRGPRDEAGEGLPGPVDERRARRGPPAAGVPGRGRWAVVLRGGSGPVARRAVPRGRRRSWRATDPGRVLAQGDAPAALPRQRGVDRGVVHRLVRPSAEARPCGSSTRADCPGSSRTRASGSRRRSARSRC